MKFKKGDLVEFNSGSLEPRLGIVVHCCRQEDEVVAYDVLVQGHKLVRWVQPGNIWAAI